MTRDDTEANDELQRHCARLGHEQCWSSYTATRVGESEQQARVDPARLYQDFFAGVIGARDRWCVDGLL